MATTAWSPPPTWPGRASARCVLERRHVVGGAAVTEQPWGPDYKVTMLSYVVSLLPPTILRDLQLERHGYRVLPAGPVLRALPRRPLACSCPPTRRAGGPRSPSSPTHDADAIDRWDAWLHGLADVLGPLLTAIPPKLGSRSPQDVRDQARLAWQLKGLGVRGVADVTRLFSMSVADLLDDYFESPQMLGVLSVSGVIGTWAGPRSPGTAFVMAHHKIGDVGDGELGSWGFPEGGMGGLTQAMASAARSFGAEIRTEAAVARILTAERPGHGRGAGRRRRAHRPARGHDRAPEARPSSQLLDRDELPADFVDDIERWNTRSGTVKINLAVDRLPEFTAKPGFDPEVHGGTIVLARSLDEVERAFQDAVAGRAAEPAVRRHLHPVGVRPRRWRPRASTSCRCSPSGCPRSGRPSRWTPSSTPTPTGVVATVEEVAPGFTELDPAPQGDRPVRDGARVRARRRQHLPRRAVAQPAVPPAPGGRLRRLPHADRGLYQAGSATHGGGGVTGIPALQVVHQIERDERAARWRRAGRRSGSSARSKVRVEVRRRPGCHTQLSHGSLRWWQQFVTHTPAGPRGRGGVRPVGPKARRAWSRRSVG